MGIFGNGILGNEILPNRILRNGSEPRYIFLFFIYFIRHRTYKLIQYKNKSYSDNNEHHGSVALTDAQHEITLVKNYNEKLKTILQYKQ